jgi:hypothetical protein
MRLTVPGQSVCTHADHLTVCSDKDNCHGSLCALREAVHFEYNLLKRSAMSAGTQSGPLCSLSGAIAIQIRSAALTLRHMCRRTKRDHTQKGWKRSQMP